MRAEDEIFCWDCGKELGEDTGLYIYVGGNNVRGTNLRGENVGWENVARDIVCYYKYKLEVINYDLKQALFDEKQGKSKINRVKRWFKKQKLDEKRLRNKEVK